MVLEPPSKDFKNDQCDVWQVKDCNDRSCKEMKFSFFSGSGRRPVMGQWFDATFAFATAEDADKVELSAPSGFSFKLTEQQTDCFLVMHNFPRLRACSIGTEQQKQQELAIFSFKNPLEKSFKHRFQLWVKSPESSTSETEGKPREFHWRLTIRFTSKDNVHEERHESYQAAFAVDAGPAS